MNAVFASFVGENPPGNVQVNSTIVTTETPRKDDGDPPLEPRGNDAAIEAVGEMGTANAPTADDAPTGNMKEGKQGRPRKVLDGKNRPTRKTKKSSVAKPRQRRVVESSDDKDFVAEDASDDASDEDESNKRGRQSNRGKKAGADDSNKTNKGQKKRGNEAINDVGLREHPAKKL